MAYTPNIDLPLLYENQSQKSVTINQAFTVLDRVVQLSVTSRTNVVPTPTTDGEAYIVTAGATGVWAGQTNNIAVWNATEAYWSFIAPNNGWMSWISAEATHYIYNSSAWILLNNTFLDALGNAQGDIIYRGATAWTVLTPDTAGKFLQTNGLAANPSWVDPWKRGTFTLTASATSTTVTDARCLSTSVVLFHPTTANAAADMDLLYLVEGNGSFVVNHANNGNTDRIFKYVII